MIQEEIVNNNKLIAEFMGAIADTGESKGWWGGIMFPHGYNRTFTLKYNSSWDWLLPCFEKLTDINVNFKLERNYCYIESGGEWSNTCGGNINCDFEFGSSANNTLEAAYNCLIQFIKWHNELYNK